MNIITLSKTDLTDWMARVGIRDFAIETERYCKELELELGAGFKVEASYNVNTGIYLNGKPIQNDEIGIRIQNAEDYIARKF